MTTSTLYSYHASGYVPTQQWERRRARWFGDNPRVEQAYSELFQTLGTERVTWCSASPATALADLSVGETGTIYTLCVPDDRIVGTVDSAGWHAILEGRSRAPVRDCLVQHEPLRSAVDILVPNPIPGEWIVARAAVTGWSSKSPTDQYYVEERGSSDRLGSIISAVLQRSPGLFLRLYRDFGEQQTVTDPDTGACLRVLRGAGVWCALLDREPLPGAPPPRNHPLLRHVPRSVTYR